MTCKISYNKDKYGDKVEKCIVDVQEIQEVPKMGILRLIVNQDGHRIYKEFKLNDTIKIEVSIED